MDVLAKHVAKLVEPHMAKRSWWHSLVGK